MRVASVELDLRAGSSPSSSPALLLLLLTPPTTPRYDDDEDNCGSFSSPPSGIVQAGRAEGRGPRRACAGDRFGEGREGGRNRRTHCSSSSGFFWFLSRLPKHVMYQYRTSNIPALPLFKNAVNLEEP